MVFDCQTMNTVPEDCARFVLTRSKDLANFVLTFDRVTYFVAMILMKQPIHKFSNIVDLNEVLPELLLRISNKLRALNNLW